MVKGAEMIFIYDEDFGEITGVIQTDITTAHQIQELIHYVKNQLPGEYTWDDIEAKLPADCRVYWFNDLDSAIVKW